jgi:hypothetical protein
MKRKVQELEIKRSKEYRQKYDELQKNFAADLGKQPIYNAFSVLRTGNTTSGEIHPMSGIKIDINSIPADQKKLAPRGTYSTTGMDYRAAADVLGYEGDSAGFLKDYLNTVEIEEQARWMADDFIKQFFPELRKPVDPSEVAFDSIHVEKRSQKLKLEYEYLFNKARGEFNKLARRVIAREPIDKVVKAQATKFVAGLAVNELKAYQYARAERKASKDAAQAFTRGDFEASLKAKKKELLNHEIVKMINEANRYIEKSFRDFRNLFKKQEDLSKTRDMDYVNAARAILERYGIARKKMDSPFEYLKKVKEYSPDTYNALGDIIESSLVGAGDYKKVSYDKFVEMRDAVQTLWDMSKSQTETKLSDRKVSDSEILKKFFDQIAMHGAKTKPLKIALSKSEKAAAKIIGSGSALKRVEHWSDYMDLGDINGPFKDILVDTIRSATTDYRLAKNDVVNKYKAILEKYRGVLKQEKINLESLNVVLDNHGQLVMMLLHSGNESNKSKLLRGYGWGTLNEDGSLNSSNYDDTISKLEMSGVITEQHYKMAQEIWDLFESLKPQAQKAHKEMYGYYFNEITAKPLQTLFGEFRGGYIPAKVNPDLSKDAEQREIAKQLEGNNSFMYPTTGRGFTKSRVAGYAAPLDLDMNMLGGHVDSVMRFVHIEPTVKDLTRLVMNKEFKSRLSAVDEDAQAEMLIPWLQRVASQQLTEASKDKMGQAVDMVASYLRKTVAMQIMTGNVVNALQQFTGIVVAATEVKPKHLAHAVAEFSKNPNEVSSQIYEKSRWMKSVMDTNLYETNEAIKKILIDPTGFEKAQDFASKHTYFLQTATQNYVNNVVWLAAYNHLLLRVC